NNPFVTVLGANEYEPKQPVREWDAEWVEQFKAADPIVRSEGMPPHIYDAIPRAARLDREPHRGLPLAPLLEVNRFPSPSAAGDWRYSPSQWLWGPLGQWRPRVAPVDAPEPPTPKRDDGSFEAVPLPTRGRPFAALAPRRATSSRYINFPHEVATTSDRLVFLPPQRLATVEGGSAEDEVRRVAESARLTARLGGLIAEAVAVAPSQLSPDAGITVDADLSTLRSRPAISSTGSGSGSP
ncbi:hypothetical protein JCM3770_003022, partial [Rhodotorula araucariae]